MKAKKVFWGIILVLAMLVVAGGACFIALHFFSEDNSKDYIKPTNSNGSYAENHNIDWNKLKERNTDVYSWVYVPGTKVDHVVVQPSKSKSDLYYIDKDLDKNYKFAGTIFSERMNKKDYSDPITVLYGHNMINGGMFATLHKFHNPKFFKKHKKMYVYQPHRRLTYRIYSAFTYDDRHIMNSFDFTDAKVLKKFQKMTLKPKSMDKNVRKHTNLNQDSKILILSTCTNGASNTRYLVLGVLIKDEQTN